MAIKWTTPVFTIQLEEEGALDNYSQVLFSFTSGGNKVKISADKVDVENNEASVTLTQEQSALLGMGTRVQMNVLYTDGSRAATEELIEDFIYNQHEEVMSND